MVGFLIFVMGVSTVWIMGGLYSRMSDLEKCIGVACNELDELRLVLTESDKNGQE
jgi:hypothetical protein